MSVERDLAIDEVLRDVSTKLGSIQATLDRVEEQTNKTNGRVTAVESYQEKQKGYIAGVSAVVTSIGIGAWEAIKHSIK